MLIESLRSEWGLATPDDETGDMLPAMIGVVRSGLFVERAGNTRIIDLGYTSFTPEDAAALANAYAHVYVRELKAENDEATRLPDRASDRPRRRDA